LVNIVALVSVKFAEEVGICESSRHLILTEKKKRIDASCCPKTCAASADSALFLHEFLTKHDTTVFPQPPYSPGLAPADLFLLPKWKSSLKGRRFQTVEELEKKYDRRHFDMGHSRRPAKHVPGRVPEL